MTVKQILDRLACERIVGSRFPVRIIFTDSVSQHRKLVKDLSRACDMTIHLGDLCTGDDVLPRFLGLCRNAATFGEKHFLLLSVDNYLRLAIKREMQPEHCQLRPLWESQQPAESRRRIIVPLFACKDIFHGLIPSIDERQADYLWELECDEPGNRRFTVSVFAPIFRHALKELKPIVGMKKWLTYCERDEADTENFSIVTGLWGNAQNTSGIVSVRVIESPFDYVSGMVSDGHKLKREWGTEQQWASLVSQVVNNAPFNRTILSAMNLLHFDIRAMLAQWRSTDANKRWLTWLWYRVNEVSDYYGYVFGNLTSLSSLEKEMCHAIFRVVSTRPEWIPQYLEALESLGVQSFDREYFDHLDALPLPETRLALLTGRTHEERAFAIRTVGYWLRKGASLPAVLESIRDRFPLLAAYLEPTDSYQSTELTDYFRWYREQKLRNEYPGTTPIPKVNLENYDSRYSKLSQYSHQDCYMLWIDGMGVEWMPLLLWCIRRAQPDSTVEWHVTTSLVPTETQDNAQWEELACPYEKWNRLDSLAHKGMPDDQDYYSCIAYQFEVIEAAAERAVLLLKESDCVVITSDHGSSRMAALSFHISESLSAPVGSRVRSYGRYCELSGPLSETDRMPCVRHVRSDNTEYLVMTTHDHYSQSGNAAGVNSEDQARSGEIHGGMTPEEYLVPVVVLRRSVPLTPLDYRIEDPIQFRDKGQARLSLQFTRPIKSLEVSCQVGKGTCSMVTDDQWTVFFPNIGLGSYDLEVVANGTLLTRHASFEVKAKGIGRNPDPFEVGGAYED